MSLFLDRAKSKEDKIIWPYPKPLTGTQELSYII